MIFKGYFLHFIAKSPCRRAERKLASGELPDADRLTFQYRMIIEGYLFTSKWPIRLNKKTVIRFKNEV